jgi:uncharacterized coiled-coil protein SlyX
VNQTSANTRGIAVSQNNAGAQAAVMNFVKSRGTAGSPLAVANGDYVHSFGALPYSGSQYLVTAGFDTRVNGTVTTSSVPTDLVFFTKPTGTSDPYGDGVIWLTILGSNGNVGIHTTAPDQALSVSGNADKSSGGTSWGTFCDRRWKNPDSIRRFELGLDWIRTLPSPVRFRYAKDNGIGADPLEENVNFIAQDLQDGVHDNLVYTTRSKIKATDKEPVEMYGVNVNEMHFAMVNAIKELTERDSQLAQQNSELAEQNQAIVEQNQTLREEVRLLKTRLDTFEQTIKLAAS